MNYLSLKEFVWNFSNVKTNELLNTLRASGEINIPRGIYLRDDKFTTDSGIVIFHPTKGTHWVMFVNEFYFDSYGCPPPLNIMKQIKNGFYSEYQIQKNDSYCLAYCLYNIFLHT